VNVERPAKKWFVIALHFVIYLQQCSVGKCRNMTPCSAEVAEQNTSVHNRTCSVGTEEIFPFVRLNKPNKTFLFVTEHVRL
jgi:hypothetical protein